MDEKTTNVDQPEPEASELQDRDLEEVAGGHFNYEKLPPMFNQIVIEPVPDIPLAPLKL